MIKKITVAVLLMFNIQALSFFCCTKAANFNINFTPTTSSLSLINLDTDVKVYSKDDDKQMFPASTTKIMTYIITAERVSDFENTKVTVKESVLKELEGTGSSLSGLEPEQTVSVKQLLHCLMISSGNDAALVLADFIGDGNVKDFVDLMNEKAKELGCTNTHFVNPHGLFDREHYTTADDLAKITKHALTLPDFLSICSQTVSYIMGEDKPPLVSTNYMISKTAQNGYYYYKYAKGIKTGHLDESGYCLVSTAVYGGYNYLCIALGAPSIDDNGNDIKENYAMLDSRQLYRWAFTNLDIKSIATVEDPLAEIKVSLSFRKDSLLLCPETDVSAVLPKSVSPSSIDVRVEKPDAIDAPIKKGQKIGTAIFSYANQEITRVDLVAIESVDRSFILSFFNTVYKIISSKIFIVSILVFLLLTVIYVIMILVHRREKIKNKRNKYNR